MKNRCIVYNIIILFAMMAVVGCAKTTIKSRHELVTGKLPRPGQIWIYSFAASPDEIPENSALTNYDIADAASPTVEHAKKGQHLGLEIATELVNQIHAMGMPAGFGTKDTIPRINDLVIQGYLVSFDKGDATKNGY